MSDPTPFADFLTARRRLVEWRRAYNQRDVLVLEALLAGRPRQSVQELAGLTDDEMADLMREHVRVDRAAVVRARARMMSGLTAPAFDLSLQQARTTGGEAMQWLRNAVHDLANPDPDQPADAKAREARADALWTELEPELDAMLARAQRRRITNWADAAQERGQGLAYADDDPFTSAVRLPLTGGRTAIDPAVRDVVSEEGRDLASQMLNDRVPGLRDSESYYRAGVAITVRWLAQVEWPVPGGGGAAHTGTGTVVELAEESERRVGRGSLDTHWAPDGKPGRYWWGHLVDGQVWPYRIAMVSDDELPEALTELLLTGMF